MPTGRRSVTYTHKENDMGVVTSRTSSLGRRGRVVAAAAAAAAVLALTGCAEKQTD